MSQRQPKTPIHHKVGRAQIIHLRHTRRVYKRRGEQSETLYKREDCAVHHSGR